MTDRPVTPRMWLFGAACPGRGHVRPTSGGLPMDGTIQIIVIVLIVLLVLGYFGRGRFRA